MMTFDFEPSFVTRIPPQDDRERRQCTRCGFIDYVNPRVVAGVVASRDGRILLCRRAIEPRKGFWTLPAGFMEEGEDVPSGALREAREEAKAEIEIDGVLAVYSVPRISQVQIFFRGTLTNKPSPGSESQEVGLFAWEDIPWPELAFPTVLNALNAWKARQGLPLGQPDLQTILRPPSGV